MIFLLLAFLTISCGFSLIPETTESHTVLAKGQVISLENAKPPIFISDSSVAQAKSVSNQFLLTAKKIGRSQINFNKTWMTLDVVSGETFRSYQKLLQTIKQTRGLKISIDGDSLSVEGEILHLDDLKLICNQAKRGIKFKSLFKIFPLIQNDAHQFLKEQSSLDPTSKSVCGISGDLLPEILAIEKQYQVQIKFMLASKKFIEQVGLSGIYKVPLLTLEPGQLEVMLNQLSSSGTSHSAVDTTLTVANGNTSVLNSGGEFALRTRGFGAAQVQWKPYGLSLKVTPSFVAARTVKVLIDLSVSSLDHSQTVEDIPGLSVRAIQQQVSVKEGTPVVIGQLTQAQTGDGRDRFFALKQIPLLNSLFSNSQSSTDESELIVVLKVLQSEF